MEKTMRELIVVLDVLVAHHRELLMLEQKKLTSIINQDWKGLEELLSKSKQVLRDIEDAEKLRLDLIEKLCGSKDAKITDIKIKVPEELTNELQKSGKKLISLIQEQKILNENIEKLLQSSLEIVNFSVSLFSGMGSNGKTYTGSGKEKGSKGKYTSFVFDVKA